MKKHVSQMTSKEIKYLTQRFKSFPQSKWSFNKYSKKRAIRRGVDMAVFRSIWTDGFDLIEYHKHEESGDNRILVRSQVTDSNDSQVCAVFNFSTMEVTTVYLNWRKNKHEQLIWSEYSENVDIKQLMLA